MGTVKYEGDLLSLDLAHATEEQIREFAGHYLTGIRYDGVAELRTSLDTTQTSKYAAPWKGDLLVKPAGNPDVMPLVIPGECKWAVELFGA